MSLLSKGLSRLGANLKRVAPVAGSIAGFVAGGPAGAVAGYKAGNRLAGIGRAVSTTFGGGGGGGGGSGLPDPSMPRYNDWVNAGSPTHRLMEFFGLPNLTDPHGNPIPRVQSLTMPKLPGGLIGGVGGVVGGEIINRLTRGATSNGDCGCNHRGGRDSCTGQRISSQPAPLATFFGGCCPPGRVLRRVNNGRDICMKKPRMNPFNPDALARADRRVRAFAGRAAPMLKELGFQVSRNRRPKVGGKKRRRRAA